MRERSFYYAAAALFSLLGVLVLINFYIAQSQNEQVYKFLSPYELRGMSVEQENISYTLNFKQQNQVLEILNNGTYMEKALVFQDNKSFDGVTLYLFDGKPNIHLKTIGEMDDNVIFQKDSGYLFEHSDGKLEEILEEASQP